MSGDAGLALVVLAYCGPLDAPDAAAGLKRVRTLLAGRWNEAALQEAVATQIGAGLLREPIRLCERSLHCRWRLELTDAGRETVHALLTARGTTPDTLLETLRSET